MEPADVPQEARLKGEVEALQAEVHRLHRKLERFHVSDYNALRRAYRSLAQHVTALEEEARGMLQDLAGFETLPVPPQLVAQELGVAAVLTVGIGFLQTTLRALHFRSPAVTKGLWLLGGAVVVVRLTGGALAHMASLFTRNASRKRRLQEKLAAVEERIHVMVALQQWAEKQEGPSAESPEAEAELEAAAGEEEGGWRRVSPAASAGSSAESAEMVPRAEELEAAEAGEAAAAAESGQVAGSSSGAAGGAGKERTRASSGSGSLAMLLAYAELGAKKK